MLVERYPLVWVAATAGAGKTTAVVQAARVDRAAGRVADARRDRCRARATRHLPGGRAGPLRGAGRRRRHRRAGAAHRPRRGRGPARRGGRDEPGAAGHRRARAIGRRPGGAGGARRLPPLCAADHADRAHQPARAGRSTWATPRPWAAWPPSARPTWPSRPRRQGGRWPTSGRAEVDPIAAVAGDRRVGRRSALRGLALGGPCRGHRRRGRPALRLPVVADPRAARRRRPRVPGGHVAAGGGDAGVRPRRSVSPPRAIACSRCAPRTCR